MKKYPVWAEVREHPYSTYGGLIGIFVVCWLSMLAAGTLGHHWNNEFLKTLSYFDVFLIRMATAVLRRGSVTRWIIGKPE